MVWIDVIKMVTMTISIMMHYDFDGLENENDDHGDDAYVGDGDGQYAAAEHFYCHDSFHRDHVVVMMVMLLFVTRELFKRSM